MLSAKRSRLDIGCGSGLLSIAIAREFDDIAVNAIDINEFALIATRYNAQENGGLSKINVLPQNTSTNANDVFCPFKGRTANAILADLPFVPTYSGRGKTHSENYHQHVKCSSFSPSILYPVIRSYVSCFVASSP